MNIKWHIYLYIWKLRSPLLIHWWPKECFTDDTHHKRQYKTIVFSNFFYYSSNADKVNLYNVKFVVKQSSIISVFIFKTRCFSIPRVSVKHTQNERRSETQIICKSTSLRICWNPNRLHRLSFESIHFNYN